jgi:hypothetical protein
MIDESHPVGRGFIILMAILLCIGLLFPPPSYAKPKRGEEPQCQEECLREHCRTMKELSEGLLKTGNRREYQDLVEQAVSSYSSCLTNCREVLPVK